MGGSVDWVLADFPSWGLKVTWPDMEYSTGKMLLSGHAIGADFLSVATVYGFAQGPTYPQAVARSTAGGWGLQRGSPQSSTSATSGSPWAGLSVRTWRFEVGVVRCRTLARMRPSGISSSCPRRRLRCARRWRCARSSWNIRRFRSC